MKRNSSADTGGVDDADSNSIGSQSAGRRKFLTRTSSFAVMTQWLGEQAQTQFLDRNTDAHFSNMNCADTTNTTGSGGSQAMRPVSSIPRMILHSNYASSYNSFDQFTSIQHQIRFQVSVAVASKQSYSRLSLFTCFAHWLMS